MTTFRKEQDDGNVHVYPSIHDEPNHDMSEDCWCEPEVKFVSEYGIKVISHRRTQ